MTPLSQLRGKNLGSKENHGPILNLFLKLPVSTRLRTYNFLAFIGRLIWPPDKSKPHGTAQRLPFGLYMKCASTHPTFSAKLHNEFTAVQLVRKFTTVPVPRPIDLIFAGGTACLITTLLPGTPLPQQIERISSDRKARKKLIRDLGDLVAQLRTIPNRFADTAGHTLCNSYGGPLLDRDGRLSDGKGGPFATEAQFNETLRVPGVPGLRRQEDARKIRFAHADLGMRNILFEGDEITGVLDWACGGWWPEWWEYMYMKCYLVEDLGEPRCRWMEIVGEVFEGLAGEREPYGRDVEMGLDCG